MKKIIFSLFAAAFFAGILSFAVAANLFDITFPVAELGNCANQAECKTYCDIAANQDACAAFAEAHGFVSQEQAKKEKAIDRLAAQGGPGGCSSRDACRAYCTDAAHQDECIAFGKKHGLIDENKAKVLEDIAAQGGPGGCKSEEECRTFCEDPVNRDACMQFAVDHGFMTQAQMQQAQQMENRVGPGGCKGEACKEYCDKPENQDACLQFAVQNNLISQDELAKIQKFKDITAQGGPGGCANQDACRAYCADAAHQDECIAFAKEHGLISGEQEKMMERGRELARKVKEMGGPGGCKSEEECKAFCANPDNVDACLAFAVQQGGMDEKSAQQMLEEFAQNAAEQGDVPATSSDAFINEHLQRFRQFRDMEGKFRGGQFQQGALQGPGGCTNPEECMQYCSDPAHRDECAKFNPPTGASSFGCGTGGRLCPQFLNSGFNGGTSTEPQGNRMPFRMMPPQRGTENSTGEGRSFQACPQIYVPVCGTDGRTYPNECFAKNSNVTIAKDGPCGSSTGVPQGGMMPPQGSMPPAGMMPYPGSGEGMMNPTQYPPAPQQPMPSPPQSRNVSDVFFGMVLDAFRSLIPR